MHKRFLHSPPSMLCHLIATRGRTSHFHILRMTRYMPPSAYSSTRLRICCPKKSHHSSPRGHPPLPQHGTLFSPPTTPPIPLYQVRYEYLILLATVIFLSAAASAATAAAEVDDFCHAPSHLRKQRDMHKNQRLFRKARMEKREAAAPLSEAGLEVRQRPHRVNSLVA